MKVKKTKDGYVLVCDSAEEAEFARRFIAQGICDEKRRGENAYGEHISPYDLNNAPGFRH